MLCSFHSVRANNELHNPYFDEVRSHVGSEADRKCGFRLQNVMVLDKRLPRNDGSRNIMFELKKSHSNGRENTTEIVYVISESV